jgi:biotin carboxyl carrier protein
MAVHEARIDVDGEAHDVRIEPVAGGWRVIVDGESFAVTAADAAKVTTAAGVAHLDGRELPYAIVSASRAAGAATAGRAGPLRIRAPMNGRLERVVAKAGDKVAAGDALFVLEAMKMHNEVRAPGPGTVKAVHFQAGAVVGPGDVVVEIEPAGR